MDLHDLVMEKSWNFIVLYMQEPQVHTPDSSDWLRRSHITQYRCGYCESQYRGGYSDATVTGG